MKQGYKLEEGEILSPEALLEFPIFSGLSKGFLTKNLGAVVRRRFKKDDIICREGEYRYTAFYILEGTVDVFINTQMSHVKTRSEQKRSWFRKMTSFLDSREPDSEASSRHQRYIRIDAPLDRWRPADFLNPTEASPAPVPILFPCVAGGKQI